MIDTKTMSIQKDIIVLKETARKTVNNLIKSKSKMFLLRFTLIDNIKNTLISFVFAKKGDKSIIMETPEIKKDEGNAYDGKKPIILKENVTDINEFYDLLIKTIEEKLNKDNWIFFRPRTSQFLYFILHLLEKYEVYTNKIEYYEKDGEIESTEYLFYVKDNKTLSVRYEPKNKQISGSIISIINEDVSTILTHLSDESSLIEFNLNDDFVLREVDLRTERIYE